MYKINEVSLKHINNLEALQLSQLLHELLRTEARVHGLEECEGDVPFNITTGDAGSDGRIKWNGTPPTTKWLKNKHTIFQNKATHLIPSQCAEEILATAVTGQPRRLKEQLRKLVEEDGCYVLFTTQSLVQQGIDDRIAEFRKAIKEANHTNHETFQIFVYDANKIKDWVNEHASVVAMVQGFNDVTRPMGFMTWEKWKAFSKADSNTYQSNDIVNANKSIIETSIIDEKVIRVTGHSGLGKTRLVLEAFRDSALKSSVVYYDNEGNDSINEIRKYLISHQESQEGIIVIDNCDVKSHKILSPIAKFDGGLTIITIGLDEGTAIDDLQISLDRNSQRDLVMDIIENKLPSHTTTDKEYIKTVCEGYPWMAIRFCDKVLQKGMSELNKIPVDDFIAKLLFNSDKEEYDVIRACSIFSSFGFLDDSFREVLNDTAKESLKAQTEFIRTEVYDGDITETRFREICIKYKEQDIIEKKSIYYIVKPTILAINLASNWLVHTDSDRIIKIIQELKGKELDKKFAERFKDLDQLDKAKDIVKELWAPESPFGTAEVLNTSWGSQLFRYVVEVNPVITTETLTHIFSRMSKAEIKSFKDGRRNIVWALEKLVFRKETFSESSKVLYMLAVSENEKWGNNATNQFIQLFQLFLSGTQANLNEKLAIVEWGLGKNDDDYDKIAIQALGRGLINGDYTRMIGAENQGSGVPLKEYKPDWSEITSFRNRAIKLLTTIACSNKINAEFAQEKLVNGMRSLFRDNEYDQIIDSIQIINKTKGTLWEGAIQALKHVIAFEKNISIPLKQKVNDLLVELEPEERDVKSQLRMFVSKPDWQTYDKEIDENWYDQQRKGAEDLAIKIVDENLEWKNHIADLLQGEQRQSFNFGKKIGELGLDKLSILNLAIDQLIQIDSKDQNCDFIVGLLASNANKVIEDEIINRFISNESIRPQIFYIGRVLYKSLDQINGLFELVDKFNLPVTSFLQFQYGRALDNLKIDEVVTLARRINSYGTQGLWTSLSLLFMYCYNEDSKWKSCEPVFREIVSSSNLMLHSTSVRGLSHHHWTEVVQKLLKLNDDPELAKILANYVIEFCTNRKLDYSVKSEFKNVLRLLFENYFEITWTIIGAGILSDYLTFFHLEILIKPSFGNGDPFLFQSEDRNSTIIQWCRENPSIASERIAHMMPLAKQDSDDVEWNTFSKSLIDEFGNNKKFLSQLSSNMGTFSSVGSSVPYYETQLKLLLALRNNKNEEVKLWAKGMIEYTEKSIKMEKLNDENNMID